MYDPEQRNEFILMRSHGMTIREIAESMNIAKSTIQEWCVKYGNEIIESRREAFHDALREIGMDKIERVKALGTIYRRLYQHIGESYSFAGMEKYTALFLKIHKELEGEENWSHIKPALLRRIAENKDMIGETGK